MKPHIRIDNTGAIHIEWIHPLIRFGISLSQNKVEWFCVSIRFEIMENGVLDLPPAATKDTNYIDEEARQMEKPTELSASEAVYGFAAWLTTRYEPVTLSAHHDAGIVVGLVAEFCKVNGLSEPRDRWEDNLTHPADAVRM